MSLDHCTANFVQLLGSIQYSCCIEIRHDTWPPSVASGCESADEAVKAYAQFFEFADNGHSFCTTFQTHFRKSVLHSAHEL
ncbi:hypothetical protein ACFXTO_039577 [Malus domestica]